MDKNVMTKIVKAQQFIKESKTKKKGKNTFSNYEYFTPEQIDTLVFNACKEAGITAKFQLIRTELGIEGILDIIDLSSGNETRYTMASDIPIIKATNVAQQLGGAMTYTKRYMLMSTFDIVDNNLDFDNSKTIDTVPEPKVKTSFKPTMKAWQQAIEGGKTIEQLEEYYTFTEANKSAYIKEAIEWDLTEKK